MSANLDRFACGFTPRVPFEVGYCKACESTIYDYEKSTCNTCDEPIHDRCKCKCQICEMVGCGNCIEYDHEGFALCEECRKIEDEFLKTIRDSLYEGMTAIGYYYAGLEWKDGYCFLTFMATDKPMLIVSYETEKLKVRQMQ